MRHFVFFLMFISFGLAFHSCYKEEVFFDSEINRNLELAQILRMNHKDCSYDHNHKSLRLPLAPDVVENYSPFIEFQEFSSVWFEGKKLENNCINNLGKVEINKAYDVTVETKNKKQKLTLTFTNLPIVQLITPNRTYDEPKAMARLIVNRNGINSDPKEYIIGMEYRGVTSQTFPKKSYGISLKGSMNLDDNISKSLFDMNKNNDWILDAMYIDKARLRNKTSFELWKKIDRHKTHYSIGSVLVELFINNEHLGLYCLNENMNEELIEIEDENAVLYKAKKWENGATQFEIYSNQSSEKYVWDGWEQKYPKPERQINWTPLRELRSLIVDGNNNDFTAQISSTIDVDNFIDYYIFLNLTSATDNTGKNTFLYKADLQSKFLIIPWDLDGSWGISWDGSPIPHTGILSNKLFERLLNLNPDGYKEKLKTRWKNLQKNEFSKYEIQEHFKAHFERIEKSGIIDIENQKWELDINIASEREYLLDWIDKRMAYLDKYYQNI